VESWTESQEASHVSHFQAPENEKDKKTQGTYGQASQTLFDFADPDGSSSKTCQDWLPLGCVTSCKTWDKWVIERRGTYSQRKKLALHTKGNESSSLRGWATPMSGTKDHMGSSVEYYQRRQRIGKQVDLNGQVILDKWATPQASDHIEGARTAKESNQKCLGRDLNQMNWATPNTMDYMETRSAEGVEKIASGARKGRKRPSNLREQVDKKTCDIYKEQNWPTPRAGNPGSRKPGTGGKILAEEAKIHNGLQDQEKSNTSGKNHGSPKLNPSWVEQLMGLSTGWTDLDSWGMELSPKQQN